MSERSFAANLKHFYMLVNVLSASNIPITKHKTDPYVKLSIRGIQDKC
jgi:hypothetical protein